VDAISGLENQQASGGRLERSLSPTRDVSAVRRQAVGESLLKGDAGLEISKRSAVR